MDYKIFHLRRPYIRASSESAEITASLISSTMNDDASNFYPSSTNTLFCDISLFSSLSNFIGQIGSYLWVSILTEEGCSLPVDESS